MKTLKQHIQEAFNLSEAFKLGDDNYTSRDDRKQKAGFESHVTNSPRKFDNSDFVVNSQGFKKSYILNLMEYAKEIIDNKLIDGADLDFVKNWYIRAKNAYNNTHTNMYGENSQSDEYLWLCNGEEPYFGNAKFTYDLLKYAENKSNLTIPRKKKINKMIHDYWFEVEKYASEMNWY